MHEAREHRNSVVTGEGEPLWPEVLRDFHDGYVTPFCAVTSGPARNGLRIRAKHRLCQSCICADDRLKACPALALRVLHFWAAPRLNKMYQSIDSFDPPA